MNKEERIKQSKSTSSTERQELIFKKMKAIVIEVWSVVLNRKYYNKEVYELMHILNCILELRVKNKKYLGLLY